MLFKSHQSTTTRLFLPLQLRILLSTLSAVWVIQKKSNTYLMSLLMTCSNRGGHSRQSLICTLRERLLGLKFQELQCCRFFGASSIELISIMRKGCGKNSLNPSIPSLKTKRIWHNTLRERRKPLSLPESPLHLPTEEPILGYLKFSAKGTKREVFGMPIPNELITDDIRGADYYDAYLKKVAKHQRYLAGEEVSDPDSPAPKPAKSTKPKITKQAKPVAPKAATKKPQPAPTKPKEKKRKQAKETTEATPPAKRAKAGKVAKKRTLKKSQQLVDEFVDEGIPLTEPGFGDLEADTQRAIEESLKDAHGAHRGPLPPVVFRETDTGKFQPLPEKKSPAEQYIFQRRTFAPTKPSGLDESSSLYAELGLTKSDMESDEEVPPVVKSGAPDEGQAGPNPGIQDKGEAGPNPGNDIVSQTLSTPGVHAGLNLEHTDAEATDAGQPQPGQMDEEFTATVYPNNQENLKLTVDDPVIPEEPASSTGTLSSLQHLAKDFSFGDQFFNDKPLEANNEKATTDTEAESMVSVTIHQDTSAIPPMTSPVIDLVSVPDSPTVHRPLPTTTTATATTTTTIMTTIPLPPQPQQVSSDSILINRLGELEQHIADLVDANQALEERLDKHGSRLYRLENQDIPNQVSKAVDEIVTDAVDWAMHAPLRERFRDLPEADMKEILHNRMWESKSYQTHEDHMTLYEALEKSMARDNRDQLLSDLAEARKKKKKRQGSPKTPSGSPPHPPPPPPPPAGPSGTSGASGASGSSQSPPPPPPPSNNMTSPVIDLVSVPDSPTVHRPLPTTTTATATTTTTIMTTIPLPPQPQQVSSDSILLNRLGELEQHIADLVDANQALEERLDKHGSRLYRLENQDIPNQVSKAVDEIVTDAVDWAMHAPLRERFRDLPEADMKEILHNRMWESKSYQTHEDHMTLYEALEKSMARDNRDQLLSDLAEARKKKKKRRDSPKTPYGSPPHPPPPPPPPVGPSGTSGASSASRSSQSPPPPLPLSNTQGGQSTSTAAPNSSKTAASAEYTAWTMTDTRIKPSVSPIPEELHMGDDTTADEQAYSSSGEDVGRDHIPTVNLRQSWWKPITEDRPATPEPAWSIPSSDLTVPTNNWASALKSTYTPPPENSLLAQIGDMATFMDWYCKKQGISELTQKDLEGPAYEIVKVFHPDVVHLQFQMEECHKLLTDQVDDAILRYNVSKPLPLGGDPGHVTIQPDFFFNKDLEYLRYGRKIGRPALSILKMKVAYYPDVGLEQMVPDQMWIEEECKYDVTAMAVRTHMRVLSVVGIEVFPMYGYNYMKKIVLRRAYLKEYVISERDFKYLYPSDFEDLYLLNLQGHLNHLSPEDKKILTTAVNLWTRNLVIRQRVKDFQLGIESYQTQLNLTKPRWDAKGFEYKHDFTVIDSPRAVTFRDKYGVQMIMWFNEIHKFSDGTLHQIDEALDYKVKEFRVNKRNPGLDTRFWTKTDVDRSREFMFAIQKRRKTRRIFRNLESFVGGRIRDGDYQKPKMHY
ncbi:hypothetical protein Tco_0785522 [Tanacetum coccineum]